MKSTRRLLAVLAVGATVGACAGGTDGSTPGTSGPALPVVEAGMDAMGGRGALEGLTAVRSSSIGHIYGIEQSERPEGPWIVTYEQRDETVDFDGGRVRRKLQQRMLQFPEWRGPTIIYDDGAVALETPAGQRPGRPTMAAPFRDRLRLGPERILLTAAAAGDLHRLPDDALQRVPHHRVAFTEDGDPVTVWLNADTGLPTAVDVVRTPGPALAFVWGDVRLRTLFSAWAMEPGGLRYPHQWDVELNGTPWTSTTIVALDTHPDIDDADLTVGVDVAEAFRRAPTYSATDLDLGENPFGPDQDPVEVADGIVIFPGSWNTALVRVDDGVVVLEAPLTSAYSEQVLAEAARRWPELDVTAVVSTSDAWPHIGGLRAYVADGVPVYANWLDEPIIQRLLDAPHRREPDRLARSPRPLELRPVVDSVGLGSGPNRMVLYTIRGETSERMLMAYFPERRLLYGADLVQPMPDGRFWMTQYISELVQAVRREGLQVDTVWAMHATPMPWSRLVEALDGEPVQFTVP